MPKKLNADRYSLGVEGIIEASEDKYAFYHSFYYDQRHIARKVDAIALAVLNGSFDRSAYKSPLKCKRYRSKCWAGQDEKQAPCIYVAVCDDRHGDNAVRGIMLSTVIYDTSSDSLGKLDAIEQIADAMNAIRFSWRPRSFPKA